MERLKNYLLPLDYQMIEDLFKDFDIDWQGVEDFIKTLDLDRIERKSPYLRKVIQSEIDKGNFKKSACMGLKSGKERKSCINFYRDLAQYNITTDKNANKVYNLLLDLLNYADIDEIFYQATDYVRGKTTTDLYNCLINTKFLKNLNYDVPEFEKKYTQLVEDWSKMEL